MLLDAKTLMRECWERADLLCLKYQSRRKRLLDLKKLEAKINDGAKGKVESVETAFHEQGCRRTVEEGRRLRRKSTACWLSLNMKCPTENLLLLEEKLKVLDKAADASACFASQGGFNPRKVHI